MITIQDALRINVVSIVTNDEWTESEIIAFATSETCKKLETHYYNCLLLSIDFQESIEYQQFRDNYCLCDHIEATKEFLNSDWDHDDMLSKYQQEIESSVWLAEKNKVELFNWKTPEDFKTWEEYSSYLDCEFWPDFFNYLDSFAKLKMVSAS